MGCAEPSFSSEQSNIMTYSVHTPFDPPLVGIAGGDDNNEWFEVWSNGAPLPIGTRLDFDILVDGDGKIGNLKSQEIDFAVIIFPRKVDQPSPCIVRAMSNRRAVPVNLLPHALRWAPPHRKEKPVHL